MMGIVNFIFLHANHFKGLYNDCILHVVDGSGHAHTAGIRVNLRSLMCHRFGLMNLGVSKKVTEIQRNLVNNNGYILLGMGERYDKKSFGLSPLLYWHPDVYKKYDD